jgi:hypothetical protein
MRAVFDLAFTMGLAVFPLAGIARSVWKCLNDLVPGVRQGSDGTLGIRRDFVVLFSCVFLLVGKGLPVVLGVLLRDRSSTLSGIMALVRR